MKLRKPLLTRFGSPGFGKLAAVAVLIAVSTLPAAAQSLAGTYGFTGTTSCLISPSGFNPNLTPISDFGVILKTYVTEGTFTFKTNLTGTSQFHDVIVTQPGDSGTAPGGSSDQGSLTLSYTMGTGGTFTLKVLSTKLTMLTGPSAGLTYTISNKPPSAGWIGKNGSVVFTTSSPSVEEVRSASGVLEQTRICTRSFVLLPVE
jgi:hypothetical protein